MWKKEKKLTAIVLPRILARKMINRSRQLTPIPLPQQLQRRHHPPQRIRISRRKNNPPPFADQRALPNAVPIERVRVQVGVVEGADGLVMFEETGHAFAVFEDGGGVEDGPG